MATNNRLKMFFRMIAIIYKLGEKGLVLGNNEPLTRIIVWSIVKLISRTEMTNDQIADIVKASYDDAKDKMEKEKKEILKDAADVIEKWSKEY